MQWCFQCPMKAESTVISACKCDMWVFSCRCSLCGCAPGFVLRLLLPLPSDHTGPSDLCRCTAAIMWFSQKIMRCSWISIFIISPSSNLTLNSLSIVFALTKKNTAQAENVFEKEKKKKKTVFGTLITPSSESSVNQFDWHFCVIEVNLLEKVTTRQPPSCTSRLLKELI